MTIQTTTNPQPAKVFLSYAHADELLLNELKKHLAALRRQGTISTWHDRDITAGSEWAGQISQELEEADVILLLISPDFIASDYCSDVETARAMQRHEAGEALVIPVFIRPCDWKGEVFGKLQGLPTDARPVAGPTWSSHDEAFTVVATGIRNAIEAWRRKKNGLASPPQAAPPVTASAGIVSAYKTPKSLSTDFNPFQAARDTLSYLDEELTSRMASLSTAGYVVDRDLREAKVQYNILSGGNTVYFLNMWQGGLSGNNDALSFFNGWGNHNSLGNSTTATAKLIPAESAGEPRLDVLNISLLGHGSIQKIYTKEEFLNALWDEIVKTVDQLGRRR